MRPPYTNQSLVQVLRDHATRDPDRIAYRFLSDGEAQEQCLTTTELDARARRFAAALQAGGYAGAPVLVCCPPGPEFVVALLACFYAGAIATPCYPPNFRLESRAMERLAWLCQAARPKLAITRADQLDKARWYSHNQMLRLRWLAEIPELDEIAGTDDWQAPPHDPATPALLQYTSGSTAQPKGVMVSEANLLANAAFTAEHLELDAHACCVSWLPPYHDMGLIGATLVPLLTGFPTVQMAPTQFLARPRRWLAAITHYRGSISPAPNFAYAHCVERIPQKAHAGLDLSTWTRALNGAEPVRAETLARFAETFADCGFKPDAFVPCYGMAETTLMIAAAVGRRPTIFKASAKALAQGKLQAATDPDAAVDLVSCGNAGADQLAIVDPQTRAPLRDGQIGEIWVRNDSVAQGYWQDPAGCKAAFGGRLEGDPEPWLRTGDLGARVGGELYVTGRLKDLIIIRGRNFHPTDLEQYASACHPALADDGAAAFAVSLDAGEALVLLLEISRAYRKSAGQLDAAAIATRVTQVLLERFEVLTHSVQLLRPGSLPRTTSGKLRRAECARRFALGAFDACRLAQPAEGGDAESAPEIDEHSGVSAIPWAAHLYRIVNSILRQPEHPLPLAYSLSDLGLDSLKRMELAVMVETELGITLPLDFYTPDLQLGVLARRLNETRTASEMSVRPALEVTGAQLPLMPAQRQFLHPDNADPQRHVIVAYLRTPAGTDASVLRDAVSALAYQHDALRLRFRHENGTWLQSYAAAAGAVGYEQLPASTLDEAQRLDLRKLLWQRLYDGFDLERDPPAQAIWLDRGESQSGVLAIRLHHLISDGTSQIVLLNSLEQNLRLLSTQGYCPIAAAEGGSFGAWARALDKAACGPQVEAELGYWQKTCAGAATPRLSEYPPVLSKEDSDARAMAGTGAAGLDAGRTRAFEQRYPDSAAQYAVLITAAAAAWCALSGQNDLLLQLENHGRHAVYDLAPSTAVGWMVCFHPLRLHNIGPVADVAGLAQVKSVLAGVPNNGLGYGLLKHSRGLLAGLPAPRVTVTHRGRLDETARSGRRLPVLGLGHESRAQNSDPDSPDWRMLSQIQGGCLRLNVSYRRQLSTDANVIAWRDETLKQILKLL